MKVSLSCPKLKKVIKQVDRYGENFNKRVEKFIGKLGTSGAKLTRAYIRQLPTDDVKGTRVSTTVTKLSDGNYLTTIYMRGKEVAFIEFGAGIYYNGMGSRHPDPLGTAEVDNKTFKIGSYPKQTHAFNDYWWYTDDSGKSHYTHGTPTYAPLYHAETEIVRDIQAIAREIFR